MPRKLLALLFGLVLFGPCANAACDNADKALAAENYKQALNYYRLCSARGDSESTYKLATLYAKGLGVSAPNNDMAVRYYRRSANGGYAPAQIMAGLALLSAKEPSSDDRIEGYKWLLLASENGDNKWMYQVKDSASSDKFKQYLTKFSNKVSDAEKRQAIAGATAFKQEALFTMAKAVLGKEDYKNFMAEYAKGGESRAAALEMLKAYSEQYQK